MRDVFAVKQVSKARERERMLVAVDKNPFIHDG
jgi:hypothetical protein